MGRGPSKEEKESRREQVALQRETLDYTKNYKVPGNERVLGMYEKYMKMLEEGKDVASDPLFAGLMQFDQLSSDAVNRRWATYSPTGSGFMRGRSATSQEYATQLDAANKRSAIESSQLTFGQQYSALQSLLINEKNNAASLDLGRFGTTANIMNAGVQNWGSIRQADFQANQAYGFNWGGLLNLGAQVGLGFATGGMSTAAGGLGSLMGKSGKGLGRF